MDVVALGKRNRTEAHKVRCPSAVALAEQIKNGAALGLTYDEAATAKETVSMPPVSVSNPGGLLLIEIDEL
jgi:hypothetical protein